MPKNKILHQIETQPISVAPSPSPVPELTLAEKIWTEIKDKPIEMFGLPNQTPAKYCQPVKLEPSKLYLTFTIGSVLPAMEAAFKNYDFTLLHQFITVSPKS